MIFSHKETQRRLKLHGPFCHQSPGLGCISVGGKACLPSINQALSRLMEHTPPCSSFPLRNAPRCILQHVRLSRQHPRCLLGWSCLALHPALVGLPHISPVASGPTPDSSSHPLAWAPPRAVISPAVMAS